MRIVVFCQSLRSDWNHGNAHFLRGIVSELIGRGHEVRVWEPADNWSLANLRRDHGDAPLQQFELAYPGLVSTEYDVSDPQLEPKLEGADLILVHEWNEPDLVAAIGSWHKTAGYGTLLFHDTHHRSVTDPQSMSRYDLSNYDGVLAFGESVAEVYRRLGWSDHVWTWHEAADTRVFRPLTPTPQGDLVWIGNWGDGERTEELREFLFEPVHQLRLRATICGVRYPDKALCQLREAGIEYGGWTPNFQVPHLFACNRVTVHVPRRPYATALPGIPTIRVFEALACGIPLVSAPWSDSEGLFRPGVDYLTATDGSQMKDRLRSILNDPDLAAELASRGLETILKRHTCAHRVDELLTICSSVSS